MKHPLGLAPSKIIAVHLNYQSRVREFGAREELFPSYFLKPPSSLSWHESEVVRPRGCRYLNCEGEVALIIGKPAKRISEAQALEYVSGYTVANDFSVHDFRHADRGSMLRVKGQDGFCPIGPVIVPAAEIDPGNLSLSTVVNGKTVQEADTSELIFSFAYMIADLARLITLERGDILLTGTPANSRPVEVGDVVEVAVDGIGCLRNKIVEADHELGALGVQPEDGEEARGIALGLAAGLVLSKQMK